MNPNLKSPTRVTEDIENIIKRKGKVNYTQDSMMKVPKPEEEEEETQIGFKKDRDLLSHLLKNCKGEEADTRLSLRALKEMNNEATVAKSKFDMVHGILDELEGVDARAIEQLFYYKINGMQEFE